ncbi:unnamed protein product [Auanema sp. JU1783]|nr:unnamed protein product [Auanema sp. JU1783]
MGDYEPIILPLDLEDDPAPNPKPIRGPIRPPTLPKDKDYKDYKVRKLDEKKHRVFNSCSSPGSSPYKKRKFDEPRPKQNSRDHRSKPHGISSPHGGRKYSTGRADTRVHYDSESEYSEPGESSKWLTTSAVACFLVFVVIVGIFVTFYLQSLKIINILPFNV